MLDSESSDIGGVNGVSALVNLLSKVLDAVEDELELDAEDAVAKWGRNGVLKDDLADPPPSSPDF